MDIHTTEQNDELTYYNIFSALLFFFPNFLEILTIFPTIYKLPDLFFKFLTFSKVSKFFKPVDTMMQLSLEKLLNNKIFGN